MRIPIMAAVLAGAGLIAAGCGSSGEAGSTGTQPATSTTGQDPCQAAVDTVYTLADANKTSTDTTEAGLAAAVAFATCKTPMALDAAIIDWLARARAEGKDVNKPTLAAAASDRKLMCEVVGEPTPTLFCD